MKKKFLATLLAMAMALLVVPFALAADKPKGLSQETLDQIANANDSTNTTRYWEIPAGDYQLTSDIKLDGTIEGATYISLRFENGVSTLDLNGYSITSSNMAAITNQGTLTIQDSSDEQTGSVTGSHGVDNYGNLTLESGTIHGTGTSATIQFRGNSQNASFTMKGGSVTSARTNAVGYNNDYKLNTVTTITLIGGSVGNILLSGAPTLIVGAENDLPASIDHSKITVGKINLNNWSTGTVTLKLYSGLIEELPKYSNKVNYDLNTIGALIKEPQNAPPTYHFDASGVEAYPNYYKLEKDADASPVASIGNEQYYYLPAAVAALKDGDTLKLLAGYNITNSSEALTITVPNVTLDLNGFDITSSAAANPVSCRGAASGTFTITNTSTTDKASIQSSSETISDVSVGSNSSVTLEIGENVTVDTVRLSSGARMKDTDSNRALVAAGGDYENLYAVTLNGQEYIYGGSDLSAIGIDANKASITEVTATLLGNATDGISYGNTSGVALTVDLDGHVVTGTGNTAVGIPSGADGTTLTVENGIVRGAISAAGASSKNCILTLENLTMTSNGDAGIGASGALSDGLKLTITDCTLTSINDSNMTTGIFFPVDSGVLTIENSTITGYNTGVQAYAGSVTITGKNTVITGSGVSVPNIDDETNKPAETGPIFDGSAVSIIDRNTDYGGLTSVKIEGGSFSTESGNAVYGAVHVAKEVAEEPGNFEEFNNSPSGSTQIVQVSGGAFTSSVKEYVTDTLEAELYSAADGVYTYYHTTGAANDAAKPGDAVSSVTSTSSYNVTVVYGNGTANQTFAVSAAATYILPAAPVREGHAFLGWSDGSRTYQPGDTAIISGNTTFTALWQYIPPADPSYQITIPATANGTVTVSPTSAKEDQVVTITVTPDSGYELTALTVTDFFGNQVDISRNSDGTYSFVMPASQVTVSAAFAPAQLPFTDVTEANWYYDEVYYVWANGLMQGTSATTFGPNVDTTRAMVVTILWRLEGEPASGYDMDYSDVAGGAWYADAVRWATEHGIVNGSEGQFYPGGTVTREQLAAMLYRYAQYKGYDLTAGGDLSGFADAGAVSGWAETSLAWAVGQGLLQGSDSQVDPQGSAIRAQTAAILMRFMENVA